MAFPIHNKQQLRDVAKARRDAIPAEERALNALFMRDKFLKSVDLPKTASLSAYMPFQSEIDTMPLVDALIARGHRLLMPRTPPNRTILEFRAWMRETKMTRTMYGILEHDPDSTAALLIPDIFIMPLLAFDGQGRRLGYGAGYFDQTFAFLRGKLPFLTVGVAHQAQYFDAVPDNEQDYRLDMCVTNEQVYTFKPDTRLWWLQK